MTPDLLSESLLEQLNTPDVEQALHSMSEQDLLGPELAERLAAVALEQAEADPRAAENWLAVAAAINQATGEDQSLQARIRYVQARLALRQGDAASAERFIREAQELWRVLGAQEDLARSYLGLTQVLTMQGRYDEAEEAILEAVNGLPPDSILQAQALLNLANLLRRQERHQEALPHYAQARAILEQQLDRADPDQRPELLRKLARLAANQANALMFLDRPNQAEEALHQALARFDQAGDWLNRGRTRTNLGTLYLRTGRYAAALEALNQASQDLLGGLDGCSEDELRLRQADILLLEQANAYLALNLIPEAINELEKAVDLFRSAQQPYELGQGLYTLGMVHLRNGDLDLAQTTLEEAWRLFTQLGNDYWRNRICVALATLAHRRKGWPEAAARLDQCLAGLLSGPDGQVDIHSPTGSNGQVTAWDIDLLSQAKILRLHLHLEAGELPQARKQAQEVAQLLGLDPTEPAAEQAAHLPHLRLRLEHALGSIALAAQRPQEAAEHFRRAIQLLDRQRVSLPLEEIKTAYLDDKANIYDDLILSLLSDQEQRRPDGQPSPEQMDRVFTAMEQARSRALLERLMATEDPQGRASDQEEAEQRAMRRELHWLYSQLRAAKNSTELAQRQQQLQAQESALRRLEWRSSPLESQAQPVDLATFQRTLAPDQQALVYYLARPSQAGDQGEVMAFLVRRHSVELFRNLGAVQELEQLANELRFQLGRVELGTAYLMRHRARLESALKRAAAQLYRVLIHPLRGHLTGSRLLFVPHGLLHQLPLHILWDGKHYLLEQFECSYAPSASLAVHTGEAGAEEGSADYSSLAALALTDPNIPFACSEAMQAAGRFAQSWVYLDQEANREGLSRAARQADVLHLATHGLFRPDNPFFSALKLADGWIDVREIYQLPLRARLVVLSACESGAGRVRGGDEVIGLARGFLGAGARSMVVSLWNVHDASAATLLDVFYQRLQQNQRPAAALRCAQLEAIRQGQHPYFWAPFLVIG